MLGGKKCSETDTTIFWPNTLTGLYNRSCFTSKSSFEKHYPLAKPSIQDLTSILITSYWGRHSLRCTYIWKTSVSFWLLDYYAKVLDIRGRFKPSDPFLYTNNLHLNIDISNLRKLNKRQNMWMHFTRAGIERTNLRKKYLSTTDDI